MSIAQLAAGALLAVGAAAQVPRPAGDVAINLPGGKQITLQQYRGKIVALVFISTT
ncbi:MAG: hypothetical protein ACE15B_11660 [Bryobacteraceae bacterium]